MAVVAERLLYSCDSSFNFGVHLDKYRHLSVCGNDNVLWVHDYSFGRYNGHGFRKLRCEIFFDDTAVF